MKKRLIIFSVGFILLFSAKGQSIPTFRTNVFNSYTTKHGIPEEIRNTNTFYNKNGKTVKKEIISFSQNLDTITEKRFENSELEAELVFVFNDDKKLIYRSFKRKAPLVGWNYEATTYSYNEIGLKERKTVDGNGNLINVAIVENDSLGNPIKLSVYNSNNQLTGLETADYDYPNNSFVYSVFNNQGKLISQEDRKIRPEKEGSSNYNEFGDSILYPRNWNEDDRTFYMVNYKYDELGNWIRKKNYRVEKSGDKFRNKKIDRRFQRKITYRK